MIACECDGDCENTCSGIQTCPLLCDETSLVDEMDISDYMEYLRIGSHLEDVD